MKTRLGALAFDLRAFIATFGEFPGPTRPST